MLDPGRYYRASSLRDAVRLMRHANLARLADGIVSTNGVFRPFETLVDLRNVPELRRLVQTESGWVFGAAVTLRELLAQSGLPAAVRRALTGAVPRYLWGDLTVEETLRARHHDLLREWRAVLLAIQAGVERLEFEGYAPDWGDFDALSASGRLDDGLITALWIPALDPNQRLELAYSAPTSLHPAFVCAAALVSWNDDHTVESARIAVCGASCEPATLEPAWLVGSPLYQHDIARIVKLIHRQIETDFTQPYLCLEQRQLLVKRCLAQVLTSARMA